MQTLKWNHIIIPIRSHSIFSSRGSSTECNSDCRKLIIIICHVGTSWKKKGIIVNYTVCISHEERELCFREYTTKTKMLVIDNLNASTKYYVRVFASTKVGRGPYAESKGKFTNGSKFCSCKCCKCFFWYFYLHPFILFVWLKLILNWNQRSKSLILVDIYFYLY
jgi:hypothetical protein